MVYSVEVWVMRELKIFIKYWLIRWWVDEWSWSSFLIYLILLWLFVIESKE